jgi:hypothetical protein
MLLTVSNGQLWWRDYSGGAWSGWRFVGGNVASGFTAVSTSPGRVDAFARNTDGSIAHVTYSDANGWIWGGNIPAGIVETPVATTWPDGRIDLFARSVTNSMAHIFSVDSGANWSAQESLGQCLSSSPGGVSWGTNRIDLFFRGCTQNELEHLWFDGSWGLQNLGPAIGGSPAAVSFNVQHLDVFFPSFGTNLQHMWWTGAAWTEVGAMGSPVTSTPPAPVVSRTPNGQPLLDLFARSGDGSVIVQHWDPIAGWGAWQGIGK